MPIVALTANAVSTANEMFLREGFDAFLAKPIVITELERVLKKTLPKSRLTIEIPASGKKPVSAALRKEEPADSGIIQKSVTETAPDDKLGALNSLGIDTGSGLLYCQNDMDFYQELLLHYAGEAAGKIQAANQNLKNRDLKNYEILVHALKSTSNMIGAAKLSDAAYTLERAAKDGDEETIRMGHDSAMTEYKRLADGILKIFGKPSAAVRSEAEDEILEFAPEAESDDDILEFAPEAESDDDILEFAPETESDDDVIEFYPEGSDQP